VQVDTLPSIRAHVNNTAKGKIGDEVTFDCHAEGEPQPRYSWTHNGVDLIPSAKYELTETGQLTIFDLSSEDSGMIRCTAHNSAGSEHARFELKIELPPVILSLGSATRSTIKQGQRQVFWLRIETGYWTEIFRAEFQTGKQYSF
jgi:uncharacterized protein YodC (DUF2158 family)